ncbi:hypothetical protein GE061_012354 [Apolygus lucorum]|uniref:protein-histidine N-methyltransferase n=1 Tax=Apolygus lucorum TaxID=248454 RepID=A0A6A4JU06_APOLU|nr:hypothetical protein GE061_012354 [Apolygus lucorum]
MGKKGGNKSSKGATAPAESASEPELSPQKKFDLLKNNEKLLKVTSVEFRQVVECHVQTDKLIQKSISIESEINPGFPKRDENSIQELTKWMLKFGAKIDGVEIKEMEDFGYGICATRDFAEGEFIISVPRKLMMTTESAMKSELDYHIRNDPMLAHMPNVILALFVLLEKFKGDSSFWAPYLNCLPPSYLTVMYYTTAELDALKGSPVYEPSLKQCQNIARQYVYLRNLFHKHTDAGSLILKKYFTYEQYR